MCQPFLFPLCQFREVLANPSHVADRLVLGPEDARSSVVNRYGEFKAVFGLVPEIAILVELEPHRFALDHFCEGHESQHTQTQAVAPILRHAITG